MAWKDCFVYPRHPNTSCGGIWTSETYLQGMMCDTFGLTTASFGTFDFYCNYVTNTYPGKVALSTIHSRVGNEHACNKSIMLWGHTDPVFLQQTIFLSLLYCSLQQVMYEHATSRSGLHLHTQKQHIYSEICNVYAYSLTVYEQRTKPITSAKGRGWNGHRFLCVPHRSWGFNVCNKIRQTCVSKVIVFCVTPIVPESFMIVSSINVLVWLFQNVGGFGGRSYDVHCKCLQYLQSQIPQNLYYICLQTPSTFQTFSSNPLEFPQQLRPTFMTSLGQLDMQGDPKPKPPAPGTVTDKEVMLGSAVGGMVAENSQFNIFPVGYGGWSRNSST